MFNIVLYEPEIPPNTGNIIRLTANTGCILHLIEPYGFDLSDKLLRRAGLDYSEWADINLHKSYSDFLKNSRLNCLYAFTTKANRYHTSAQFKAGDALMFGPESRGLPKEILNSIVEKQRLKIPMLTSKRSLNLSNSVSIAVYEAWRQLDFIMLKNEL